MRTLEYRGYELMELKTDLFAVNKIDAERIYEEPLESLDHARNRIDAMCAVDED